MSDQPDASQPETTDSPSTPDTPGAPRILSDVQPAATYEGRVVDVLKSVFDPEIPVNIYDLGLIYEVDADEAARNVKVKMTLTSPACPVAGSLPGEVEMRIRELEDVDEVEVELVWDPPWTKELLSEEAKLQLGLM